MAGRRKVCDPAVKLSKALSYLLRHGAEKEGFRLLPGGFLYVDDILKHSNFHSVSLEDVEHVVETNDKKRFTLEQEAETGRLKIRANQGHSLEVNDLDLKPITNASDYPIVVHGTYERPYKLIAKQGLKKMGRNHIHFAAGEPGEGEVISDGLKFYLSANNVILSPGNEDGVIDTVYFDRVINRKTGQMLYSQDNSWPAPPTLFQSMEESADTGAVTAEDIAAEFDVKKSRRKNKKKMKSEDK